MIRLHFLGTSSGLLCPGRKPSSYLLETNRGDILFDCGDGISSTLANMKYNWKNLMGVFISHGHADHAGGLPMLIQQLHITGKNNECYLYGPYEYISRFCHYMRLHYLFPERFKFNFISNYLENEEIINIGNLEIMPVMNKHLAHYDPPGEAFSFKITAGDRSFLYSADIASFDDIVPYAERSNILIVESTHIDINIIIKWAFENPDKKVFLTHIGPDFNVSSFRDLIKNISNIAIAEDGMFISL